MKPENVVKHQHFFAFDPYEYTDEKWEIEGRYDACQDVNGICCVWSPASNIQWYAQDYEDAKRIAKAMAEEYANLYHRMKGTDW